MTIATHEHVAPLPESIEQYQVHVKWRKAVGSRKLWTEARKGERDIIPITQSEIRRGDCIAVMDLLQQIADRWLERHPDHEAVLVTCQTSARIDRAGHEARVKLEIFQEQARPQLAAARPTTWRQDLNSYA